MRVQIGDVVGPLHLQTINDKTVDIPGNGRLLVHLQFRRFAGCPVCNLHLRSVAKRIGELKTAGIHEVAVFHSNAETMRPFQGDLPFDVVSDPEKKLYRRFGVESSPKSVLHPRAMLAMVKGMVASHPSSGTTGEGGHLGLPADFLIGRDGGVVACKYGSHAADQWSVDELLALAGRTTV